MFMARRIPRKWETEDEESDEPDADGGSTEEDDEDLSLIHISEPTRH